MNYKKIYYQIIEKALNENRTKNSDFYFEKHHIKPKCLGGNNKKENLVLLTAKEHYLAHLLLIEMYEGKEKAKLSYGFFRMCQINKKQNRKISAKNFEKARKLMSENCSGGNTPFYGKTHSLETKKLLSEKITGNENPSIKFGVWNKGKKTGSLSNETKTKISKSRKGFKHTDEAKNKMSKANKNRNKTDTHKKNISIALTGVKRSEESIEKGASKLRGKKQKLIICPYCKKSGGITMYRWHFENCKHKTSADIK